MRFLPLFLVFAGCPWVGPTGYEERVEDADGDGVVGERFGGDDCADDNPAILDCDADDDGFLDAAVGGDDCDDTDATVNPEAPEICSGRDDDCDGQIDDQDDSVAGQVDWFFDGDGDGVGTDAVQVRSCEPPPDYVASAGDCDDGVAATRPGVIEDCTPADRNCDGDAFAGAPNLTDWYVDADADGFGGALSGTACEPPNPTDVDIGGDCDDTDAALTTPLPWYTDADADGIGAGAAVAACQAPSGTVAVDGDCDDSDPAVSTMELAYRDQDGDGYGYDDPADPSDDPTMVCGVPSGFATLDGDCDDADDRFNPGAVEICNGRDDDCDGVVDDFALDADTYFEDQDSDGFGNDNAVVLACTPGAGSVPLVTVGGDCNDLLPDVNPGAVEICYDSIRQDCQPVDLDDCDADGFVDESRGGTDCDDADPTIQPGATEICDGLDNDCNSLIDDDADPTTATDWFTDADQDGFGAGTPTFACSPPSGTVAVDGDCDDANADAFPGNLEVCDGADNDCNGVSDDAAPGDATTWWPDGDGDTFGADGLEVQQCAPPGPTWVQVGGDCADTLPDTFPGATEFCDSVDNDCNGTIDDNPANGGLFFADNDADGFGAPNASVLACSATAGIVANGDDCNDADPDSYPGAPEICYDGLRQDCSTADLDDCDADGFIDLGRGGTDCDDLNAAVLPGALEICDGLDNDCNGLLDDADPGVDLSTSTDWFPDVDMDGFGDVAAPNPSCSQPAGHVLDDTDCNDADAAVNPGAPEDCDGTDNDCDGFADDADPEGPANPPTWYPDADVDGFGDFAISSTTCDAPLVPAVWVFDATDCNDGNAAANPGEPEICDGLDNDCDGLVDDADPSVNGQQLWYADQDNDGYVRLASFTLACQPPNGFRADPGLAEDCNDANASVSPAALEVCDGVDNDCDGLADAADPDIDSTYYADDDADGFGDDADTVQSCTPVAGYVTVGGDCVDFDPAINPTTTWYLDDDADGFGLASNTVQVCDPPSTNTWALVSGDCDDTDDRVNPAAAEVCIPLATDDDCDGLTDNDDPSLVGGVTHYFDTDGDTYGGETDNPRNFCALNVPAGWEPAVKGVDCAEGDPTINPGADEIWYDGVDQDCDGGIDYDQDGDGYCTDATQDIRCAIGIGPVSDDCDDLDPQIRPDAPDTFYDGIDSDCVGGLLADYDQDGDGFPVRLPPDFPTPHAFSEPLDCDDRETIGADRFPRSFSWPPAGAPPAECGGAGATVQELIDCSCDISISSTVGVQFDENLRVEGNTLTITGPSDPRQIDVDWSADCNSGSPSALCLTYSASGRPIVRVSEATSVQFPTLVTPGRAQLTDVVLHGGENAIGGGLRVDDGQRARAERTIFWGNVAYSAGAGVHVGDDADVEVIDAYFVGNVSAAEAAGIYTGPNSTVLIEGVEMVGNQGTRSSGLYIDSSEVNIQATQFFDNGTPVIAGSAGPGGVQANLLLVSNSIFGGSDLVRLDPSNGAWDFNESVFAAPDTLMAVDAGMFCTSCLFFQPYDPSATDANALTFNQTFASLLNVIVVAQNAQSAALEFNGAAGDLIDSVVFSTVPGANAVISDGDPGTPFGPTVIYSAFRTAGGAEALYGLPFYDEADNPYDCLSGGCIDPLPGGPTTNFAVLDELDALFVRADLQLPAETWYPRLVPGPSVLRGNGQTGGDVGFWADHTGYYDDDDGDGIWDIWEDEMSIGNPTADPDGDGVDNLDEFLNRTHPLFDDTDFDGRDDFEEINTAPLSTPYDWDSDDDELWDGDEIAFGSLPTVADTDGDTLPDGVEAYGGDIPGGMGTCLASDPTMADTDGDGLDDRGECSDTWRLPCPPQFEGPTDPFVQDTDGDGQNDFAEAMALTCGNDPSDF